MASKCCFCPTFLAGSTRLSRAQRQQQLRLEQRDASKPAERHGDHRSSRNRMFNGTISNRKLHCCLAILILFIVVFLSIPLLLIILANTNYERKISNSSAARQIGSPAPPPTGATNESDAQTPTVVTTTMTPSTNYQMQQPTNCTHFAMQANLSLADENIHCPEGTFPCLSCPEICIEQWRQCDGIADCPDRFDESKCHDSNGAIGIIFQHIVAAKSRQSISSPNAALAKPDSCTTEQFDAEQCPCVYTDPHVIICDNLQLDRVPNTLLSSVYKIRMINNSISNIDNVLWPKSLTNVVLLNNRITHISRSTFESTPNLSKLYLTNNRISHIDGEAFAGLSSLTSLNIEANRLETFDSAMLRYTPIITKVHLSENLIDLPENTSFAHCRYLKELHLDHNRIRLVRARWFSNMTSLFWLSLSHNQITAVEAGSFDWNYELEELNLSFNLIKVIDRQMFAHKLNIKRLYIGGNPLEPLPMDAFREIVHLKSLDLTNVEFANIVRGTFSYLNDLEFIYFKKFRYCHYAHHVRVCRPITDGLSSAKELLIFSILKYAVWIVASVCCLGNVFVFVWRSVSPHEDRTLSIYVKNLSIADLMMGIYLVTIGWQDMNFQQDFGRQAIDWMTSWECTATGFLAILSSELSVFTLTIITIERYRSIISLRRFEEDKQERRARINVALAWLLSLLIASYPLVGWSDYYATNGLCLPLHIDQPFEAGWKYSAFIYLGINFCAVMVIIALYSHMYTMIMDNRHSSRPALTEKREDAILAIRFFFIVVTDCLCWIPIVVIKITALANVRISSTINGWLAVFIIPINSALNPIIYTLAAPTSLRAAVCKLFEWVCYRIDQLTGGCSSNNSSQSSSSEGGDSQTMTRRRRQTGSNSTSCDTYETSIASHTKNSCESTMLMLQFATVNVKTTREDFDCDNSLVKAPSSSSPTNREDNDDCDRCAPELSARDAARRNQNGDHVYGSTERSFECLPGYQNNAVRHIIISSLDGGLEHETLPMITRRDCHNIRRSKAFDSIDGRSCSSSDSKNSLAGGGCDTSTNDQSSIKLRAPNNDSQLSRELVAEASTYHGKESDVDKNRVLPQTQGRRSHRQGRGRLQHYHGNVDIRADEIDSHRTQKANRLHRVSFSSKDSSSCLLSQNDAR